VIDAKPESAQQILRQALPDHVSAVLGPEELEGMRRRLVELPVRAGAMLGRDDYVAAFRVFLLVVFATFPVVLPFLMTDDAGLAMETSRILTLVMLFLAGFALGRHTWHPHPTVTGIGMALIGVALIAAVKALGG
jgi:VIT1/CCC1 family predicted Fe2+/Mn2+ transporter